MSTPQEAARALVKINREKLDPVFLKAQSGVILGTLALPSVYSNGNAYVKAAVEWMSAAQELFVRSGDVLEANPAGQELDVWYRKTMEQVTYLQKNKVKGEDPADSFLSAWLKEVVAEIWAIVEAAVGAIDRAFPVAKWLVIGGLAAGILILAVLWKR